LTVAGVVACLAALTASGVQAGARHAGSAQRVRTYSTSGTTPLRTALVDPFLFGGLQKDTAFAKARSAGASFVKLAVPWSSIAPTTLPEGFVASDPTSPGYTWTSFDSSVESAVSAGLTPILNISGTPKWAYARRSSGINAGTPKASAIGDFATALATHFDGETLDAEENLIPAVKVFEVWNEPNLSLDLGPVSAALYRGMVNAVANAVHAVDPANLVIAGGLDPFGHPKGKKQKWYSVSPLAYMRSLLCLSKGAHPHATCKQKVHFDIWSHHPYTFGGPFGKAKNADDVSLGDLSKMRTLLRAATKVHHIVSTHPVQFWVTEIGWDSAPPRPRAASMALASRWTAESLYQCWRSGVSLVTWFDLQDRKSPSPYQSGLYRSSASFDKAKAKPVLTAFRFPFVAYRNKSSIRVWGRDATSTKVRVTVQLRHGKRGRWRTVGYIRANRSGIFKATMKLKATKKDWVRGIAAGSGTSLAFSLTVPHEPHVGPWGN
jgi:hypothetical protein